MYIPLTLMQANPEALLKPGIKLSSWTVNRAGAQPVSHLGILCTPSFQRKKLFSSLVLELQASASRLKFLGKTIKTKHFVFQDNKPCKVFVFFKQLGLDIIRKMSL